MPSNETASSYIQPALSIHGTQAKVTGPLT